MTPSLGVRGIVILAGTIVKNRAETSLERRTPILREAQTISSNAPIRRSALKSRVASARRHRAEGAEGGVTHSSTPERWKDEHFRQPRWGADRSAIGPYLSGRGPDATALLPRHVEINGVTIVGFVEGLQLRVAELETKLRGIAGD